MRKKIVLILLTTIMVTTVLTGCGSKENTSSESNTSSKSENGEYASDLYILNWPEYITEDVLDKFKEEYGITVHQTIFETNDEMMAKLLAGNKGEFDLAVPSNFYVQALKDNDLIEPLDKEQIPNLKNIDEGYLGTSEADPDNEYFVPYMGNLSCWVGNTKLMKEAGIEINTMDDLKQDALKDKVIMIDDAQAVMGYGLGAVGSDFNCKDAKKVEEAESYLEDVMPNLKAFTQYQDTISMLVNEEATVGLAFGGMAMLAMNENSDLEVVMSGEENSLSTDGFVFLKGSEKKEEAMLFINFIMREDIYAELENNLQYVSVNAAAADLLDDNVKSSEICVISDEMKEKLIFQNDPGADILNQEIEAMSQLKMLK